MMRYQLTQEMLDDASSHQLPLIQNDKDKYSPTSTSTGGTPSNFTITQRYQNPNILKQSCSVTVLLVDPDLGEDVHWALESVVANIHPLDNTCFLLQTSICMLQKRQHTNATDVELYRIKADRVIHMAQPGFRNMIQRGNVRMTILDSQRYDLRSCLNFFNPSFLFENYQYWGPDEFDVQDSDLVLMVQGDAVLCHALHVDKWRDVAWVGAPWRATKGKMDWHFCSSQVRNWYKFHDPHFFRNSSHTGGSSTSGAAATSSSSSSMSPSFYVPPYPTENEICSDTRYGPQGNGGLSLRSRSWLQKAIQYCPTDVFEHSGLSWEEFNSSSCKGNNVHAEDLYFVTVLRGIGAPLPTTFEAALFAQEMRSPTDILKHYNLQMNRSFVEEMVQKRWYTQDDPSGMTLFRQMEELQKTLPGNVDSIVAIGLHKPWNQALQKRIKEDYLVRRGKMVSTCCL